MTTPPITKEIVYDRESHDYAVYVTIDGQREYIGSGKTYHDAEIKADDYAYHYYSDNHTPEVAARIAVGGVSPLYPRTIQRDGEASITFDRQFCKRCNAITDHTLWADCIFFICDDCARRDDENETAAPASAAPDLLEACVTTRRLLSELENQWSDEDETDRILAQIRDVIAKATVYQASPGGA